MKIYFIGYIRLFIFIFLLHGFNLYPKASASQKNPLNFNEKLSIALNNLQKHKSFEMEFQQEFYSALRDKITQSKGIVKIAAPDKFRFEIQTPRNEIFVSNGKDFWKYVPSLKHAQHLKSNALETSFLSLLTNPKLIERLYNISQWHQQEPTTTAKSTVDFPPTENNHNVSIKLDPKEDKEQKVLYAILNVREGILEELRVVQTNGNWIRLLFSNNKEANFSNAVFSFVPPQGIAVDTN